MDDERSGRARGQLSADDPSGIGTTIVGGQPGSWDGLDGRPPHRSESAGAPPGAPRQPLRAVPVGIEKVLYTAAIDPGFREALLRDREAAIRARGIALEGSELAMLRLAPEAQLASAIDALDTSERSLARRGFLRAVAGAVTLAAGSALTGCGEDAVRGIQPDVPRIGADAGIPARDIPYPPRDYAGMTDRPWTDGPMPAGIKPDLPRLDGIPAPSDGAKKED